MVNLVELIRYEDGELDEEETVEFFQGLVDSGQVWQLQGHYGRTAVAMIEAGLVTRRRDLAARFEASCQTLRGEAS
jgi:hypothetical protein